MINCKYSFWESSTDGRIQGSWITKINNPLEWSLFSTSNKIEAKCKSHSNWWAVQSVDLGMELPMSRNESAFYIMIHFNTHREHWMLPLARPTTCQCFYIGKSWLFVSIYKKVHCMGKTWAGHVARVGEGRRVYRVLVGKPEGKRSLGRPRRRWEDDIKMYLLEVRCGGYGLDRAGSG